ncbi:ABC transporter substrate-binding protein [Pseudodesulfovibrio sediminis]|uniref:ABC transporter substrate-binding protein n=1 Tax=Pseudodesulfovibrio sediminis TaxID=2810563 RepID=A0ABN6EU44_9BACT|nr:ABC transporter substrate-binding protein [Pseudodesulfovibrio sediminis]BCS88700.1 ABC transporter substrate-binding protein [Pseudodesulfovibrio sediminis]
MTVCLLVVCLGFAGRLVRADSERELVFGMSAAFTGANSELGIEFYRGLMAYLEYFNAQGGADGWTIKVTPANDGYNPAPCFQNTVRFITQDNVFALFSYVGTPTTTHILPLLQKFENQNIFLLFPFTGAQPLRSEPYGKYIYTARASYYEETAGLVDQLVKIGRTRIGVFYQSDAYGRNGWDGIRRALKKHELAIVSEASYRRGASSAQDFTDEARHIVEAEPDAIIIIGTYASQSAFIRDVRNVGYADLLAGISFADSDKTLDLLKAAGIRDGKDYSVNLINSQVVPSYTDLSLPGVRLYQKVLEGYTGQPISPGEGYIPRKFSYVSFEGFLNGLLLGEVIKRMADDPRRDRIPEVMRSITHFDMGIGETVSFGDKYQGLNAIYFTTVKDGSFQPVTDWEQWRQ